MKYAYAFFYLLLVASAAAQRQDKFKQLYEELPTPNTYRTAAGAPGFQYYQQKADYEIEVEVDDARQRITGTEVITYHNNSPDQLEYLWLQLDQNIRQKGNDTRKTEQQSIKPEMTFGELENMMKEFDGGYHLEYVKDAANKDLPYTINKTMMRVDLSAPLKAGQKIVLRIKWWFNVQDRAEFGGRMGYEYFPADSNYLYTISKFFPRMCVYNDEEGWQNKQFLGRGEFALPFGDYKVKITVPADHVVAATGTLQNAGSLLSGEEKKRLDQARNSEVPVLIITEQEAREKEKKRASGKKTWEFHAENVRDFAFASSRKFMWDAQGVKFGNRTVLAMSYYPKEGNPLWERFSTRAVVQTLRTYSRFTFDYPYPVAISVHTKNIGMEYPMICFNGGRPEPDGTYSEGTKYGMLTVIIHEVGHNFFPMIVNSDERQWTWMDEGLNTFLQYLTEQEWDRNYPSSRGPAYKIVDYMKGDPKKLEPIMTNSESIIQFGNNAYGKTATALNILRETIMGRELFDHAFKTYANRWKFRHPSPADFFRTMEDASGVDLDWFWRGWFYTTDYCDISLDQVTWYKVDSKDPGKEKPLGKKEKEKQKSLELGAERNKTEIKETVVERDTAARDFYTENDAFAVTRLDELEYKQLVSTLGEKELGLLNTNLNFYECKMQLVGGLVMPVILEFEFADGTTRKEYIPAEIWRFGDETVSKVFWFEKEVARVTLDPNLETADVNRNNNYWPPRMEPSRFQLFKQKQFKPAENPMQRDKRNRE